MPSRPVRHLTVFILCAFASSVLAADSSKIPVFHALGSRDAAPETYRGLEQLTAGKTADGVQALNSVVARNPAEFSAWYALSQHALAENDYQKSVELLCKAIQAAAQSPWAEFYIEELGRLLPFCNNPSPFLELAARAQQGTEFRALVRDQIKAHHAGWLLAQGHYAEAGALNKALHYITRWAVAGPFDNRDGSGFTQPFEPETFIDLGKSIPGRNRRVEWFKPEASPVDGRLEFGALFEPRTHVLAYAVTFAEASTEGWGVLRIGCAGALSVWVNGTPAGQVKALNEYGAPKLEIPVFVHKGWNQILVKSGIVEDMEWGFSARLCATGGGAFPALTFANSAEALKGYAADSKSRPAPPAGSDTARGMDRGIVNSIEQALKTDAENSALLAALGSLTEIRHLTSSEELSVPKELLRAAALAPNNPYIRLKIASISRDTNEARQAAESVYASHPDLAAPLALLAMLAQESRNHVIAADFARQLKAKFGDEKVGIAAFALAGISPDAGGAPKPGRTQSKGDALSTGSFRALTIRTLQRLVERHPYLSAGWQRLIDLEPVFSTRRALLQRAMSLCGGDPDLRQRAADELNVTGKYSQAAELMAQFTAAYPFAIDAILATARQYQSAGNSTQAKMLLEAALKVAPENPELLSKLAQTRHHESKTAEAVKLYKQALQIKPNSPQIKDYLSILDARPGSEQKFYAPYDIALKDLPTQQASAYPNDNVVHLLNQQVVRVNNNGSSSRMFHRVSKLLRPNGLQQLAQHSIWYEPDRQVVDILKAAVITPDGRELSRADVQDRSTSAAMGVQTRIYDEHHLKQVTFKNLEPGSMIELQYTIRDTGDNIYGDYFADSFYLSDDDPVVKTQYVLDFPKSLNLQTKTLKTQVQAERLAQSDTQREVFKWQSENTPGIAQERGMPPVIDQLAQVQISTMNSWQEVGQWYWNLAREQLEPTDEMRQMVKELTKDCKTETEKLRAVHDWVIRKIRYLGIEFGRNGYKPHRAADSFKSLYGDCKDTATLITSLLQTINIPCDLVLIRTVDAGAVSPDSLPMPNLFNHCIAYVPNVDGKAYWIDCTTDFHRLGELPETDQTAQVLAVNASGGKFLKIPPSRPEQNVIHQQFKARVERSGAAALSIQDYRYGQFAPAYRQLAETPGQYERYMKDYAARRFNGAEVEKIETAPANEQGPMWMKTTLKVPALATHSGERKALPATLDGFYLSPRFANQTTRKHDLEMLYPWTRKMDIDYELDKGLKVISVPEDIEIVEPFGKYSRKITSSENTLSIHENFELTRQRITVGEYEAFRLFCNRVDSLLDQKVMLETK